MDEIELQNGEARVKTDGRTVQEQVRRAYADSLPQKGKPGYTKDQRCLSFLTSRWLTPKEAATLVAYIGVYNDFDPERVAEKVLSVAKHCDHLRVAIGREGSPVLYFEVDKEDGHEVESAFEQYADEFMDSDPPDIADKEMYRDDDYPVDEHGQCRHTSPPVASGDEATGSVEGERVYLRAWWD